MKNIVKDNIEPIFILSAYFIPILGWMIPLYLRTGSNDSQFHGKQAFIINRLFFIILGFWWVFSVYIPAYYNNLGDYLLWFIIGTYLFCLIVAGIVYLLGNGHLPIFSKMANDTKL